MKTTQSRKLLPSITRRSALKGGAAAVAGAALGGFPTVWAQDIKDIEVHMLGSAVSHIKQLEEMAEEALGFQILQTVGRFRHPGPARRHAAALLRHGRAGLSATQRHLADRELPGHRHHQARLLGSGDRAIQEGRKDLAGRLVWPGTASDLGPIHLRHRQPRFRRARDAVANHPADEPQCRHPRHSARPDRPAHRVLGRIHQSRVRGPGGAHGLSPGRAHGPRHGARGPGSDDLRGQGKHDP